MAKKSSSGKFIISAGEVGSYTVCPEAWRLKALEGVERFTASSVAKGNELHRQWAKNYDEAAYLSRGLRLVLVMLLLATLIYFVK